MDGSLASMGPLGTVASGVAASHPHQAHPAHPGRSPLSGGPAQRELCEKDVSDERVHFPR